ncbi:hypothetical protein BH09BAC1_BH09BAC1_09040 [soil metagenome]
MALKRNFFVVYMALAIALSLSSCKREEDDKVWQVSPFSKIITSGNVHVALRQKAEQSIVSLAGSKGLEMYVQDSVLYIKTPADNSGNADVNISVASIAAITYLQHSVVSIPAGFVLEGRLQIDGRNEALLEVGGVFTVYTLSMDLRDTAAVNIENLAADKLYVIAKNHNECNISGTATRAQINLFNTSLYNLAGENLPEPINGPLRALEYFMELRGQSQAWVYATHLLSVDAYDACAVYYKGSADVTVYNLYESASLVGKE